MLQRRCGWGDDKGNEGFNISHSHDFKSPNGCYPGDTDQQLFLAKQRYNDLGFSIGFRVG